LLLVLHFSTFAVIAQRENPDIRRGNREFRTDNFQDAELRYRQALEANPRNTSALYNLAATLYKQGRYDEATNILEGLSNMGLPDNQQADVYHNLGNAQVGSKKIKEAVDAYKNSLRIRPYNNDTRHNLAYAMRLLQEQQQQQQQQQNEEQQQNDDNQEQQEQEQPQPQEDQQQQQQQRPHQITPQDAERILDALNQKEQKIQQNIDREQKQQQPIRPIKQW